MCTYYVHEKDRVTASLRPRNPSLLRKLKTVVAKGDKLERVPRFGVNGVVIFPPPLRTENPNKTLNSYSMGPDRRSRSSPTRCTVSLSPRTGGTECPGLRLSKRRDPL